MFRKILLFVFAAMLAASCYKKVETMEQYEFQKELDAETIELFFRQNKLVYDNDTAMLEACKLDSPECLWNNRLGGDGILEEGVPYQDLVGKLFKDTILEPVVISNDKGDPTDTLMLETGTWILISNRGDNIARPIDSSYVLTRYSGSLVTKQVFDLNTLGTSILLQTSYLNGGVILGFGNGLRYFETANLKTKTEEDKDGNSKEVMYWDNPGMGWLFIPSRSAYGNVYSGAIPPNSVLVFNVATLSIAKMPKPSSENIQKQIKWFKP